MIDPPRVLSEEPTAVTPHGGICGGESQQWLSYPTIPPVKVECSKEKYGTSHIVTKEEAKFVFENGCEVLIVGAGQDGNVRLSPEASAYFDKKRCRVILQPTPEAIVSFNRSRDKKIALMHVTC